MTSRRSQASLVGVPPEDVSPDRTGREGTKERVLSLHSAQRANGEAHAGDGRVERRAVTARYPLFSLLSAMFKLAKEIAV